VEVRISIAAGCKPCTDFHVRKVREAGAADAEIKQAIGDALSVRRGAADIMEAYGVARLGERSPVAEAEPATTTDRARELVCIGAAFGVNCVLSLKAHLDAAERAGISHEEVDTIVKLAAFIKGKAASHLEHLAESLKPEVTYAKAVNACC
jgi:AhpD family alkylhydroperoxidase